MKRYGSLDNYILAQRRATGLTQDELAILLGLEGRASVSRYEIGVRQPELETLIALEMVFDLPIQELFAGVAERVGEALVARARAVLGDMGDKASPENVDKLTTLARVARLGDDKLNLWRDVA